MKYIVMEVKRSYAVLLDEDGRFVTAANLRYEVGQIVENPVLMIDSGDNQKKKKRLITGFAAVLTLLTFSSPRCSGMTVSPTLTPLFIFP